MRYQLRVLMLVKLTRRSAGWSPCWPAAAAHAVWLD